GGAALVGQGQPHPLPGVAYRAVLADVSRVDQDADVLAEHRGADAQLLLDGGELDLLAHVQQGADPQPVGGVDRVVESRGCEVGVFHAALRAFRRRMRSMPTITATLTAADRPHTHTP